MLNVPGYNGLKTGVTEAAGPCLATSYQKGDVHLVIVLLNCKTMEARWDEIPLLLEWAKERIKVFGEIKTSQVPIHYPDTNLMSSFTPYE
jgi:D-alanyl-D-alanine carboxypeptidase